jgi:GGDEF domain-containing protein
VGLARVLVSDIGSFDITGASAIERLVADALRTAVRVSDWAGRLGEGSFLVVLPSCGSERAGVIAERIFRLATQRLESSGVFASVQIAVDAQAVGPEAPTAEEVVARLTAGDR